MLLVCANDASNPAAGWNKCTTWGKCLTIDVANGQAHADQQIRHYLTELKTHEPLCFVGYGGSNAILSQENPSGACQWSALDIANFLLGAGSFGNWAVPDPSEDSVVVLFHLMSQTPAQFMTQVMIEVLNAKTSNFGISHFGYTSPVDITTALPGPYQLKYKILPKGMTSLIVGRL